MSRGIRLISRSKTRLTLAGVVVVALVASLSAIAFWTTSGTGTGAASTGTLTAPTITSATPGSGSVALTWSTVTPPGSPAVTYYVQRDGGNAGGDCPTSASPTGVMSCTDTGLSAGSYDYTVTAVWRSWTARSATSTVTVTAATLDHFTIAPASGTQTAGTPFSVTVTAKDSSNNTITSYTGTIHFTSNDGAADLPADYTFTTGGGSDNGVHTFTSGVTLKTAGTGKTVTVADGGATGTGTYTVVHAAATQIALTGSIANLASGSPRTFTATIQDAYGNTVDTGADSTVSVSFAQTGGAGSVTGTGSSAAVAGVATKSLTGDVAGSVTVRASAALLAGATNSNTLTFNVVAGGATQIALTGAVTDLASGSARTFTATIQDASGNTVTTGADSTVSVSFAQTAGAGSVTGAGSSAAVAGVATKNLTGALTGSVTVRASATLLAGATNSNTLTFNVVAGAATQIALTGAVTDLASGSARTFTATVQDAAGNTVATGADSTVSVSFAQTAGAGSVSGTGSSAAVAGVATKSLTGNLAGSVTVRATASLSGPGSTNSNTLTFNVITSTATKLAFTTSPSNSTGGVAFSPNQPVVTIQDAAGNTVTTDTSSVTLALTTPAGATLTCTTNPLAAVAGVATFAGCKVDLAGTYTLTATDGALTSAVSSSFTITVGAAAKLAFTQQPSGSTGGVAFGTQPKVAIQDAGGNTVTGNTSSVTLALTTPAGATLACTTNPLAAVAGLATFAGCKVDLAGTYTLTATDGALTSAVSSSFTITVGAAAKLGFTQQPSGSTGGVAFGTQPRVAIQDLGGNTVTGNTSSVTLALTTPAGASLSCTTNPLAAVAGVATFAGCKVDLAGTYTLTATDGALTSAVSSSFTITVGAAAKLGFTQQPSGSTGGVAFGTQPRVAIQDLGGNTVTGNTSSVTLALTTPAGATLSCTTNPLAAVAGVATFAGCKVDLAGTYTLTATDGALTSAVSSSFTITVGAAAKLAFTQQPSSSTGGVAFGTQPRVAIQDAGGNPVTTDTSNVTLALTTPAGATLTCTTNPLAAVAGVATFAGCKVNLVGTYTLTATDGALTSAVSSSFTITAGTAASLVLAAATTTPVAGAGNNLTITARDAGGNTATSYTGDKSLTFTGAATIGANVPTVSNKTGVATNFSTATTITFTSGVATVSGANNGVMKLYKVETASIVVSDGTINNGAGLSVTVSAASASALRYTSSTTNGTGSADCSGGAVHLGSNTATWTTKISVVDAFGNLTTNATGGTVTINITKSPNQGTGPTPASLTIANAATETSASFSFTNPTGNPSATTQTATATGAGASWTTVGCAVDR